MADAKDFTYHYWVVFQWNKPLGFGIIDDCGTHATTVYRDRPLDSSRQIVQMCNYLKETNKYTNVLLLSWTLLENEAEDQA